MREGQDKPEGVPGLLTAQPQELLRYLVVSEVRAKLAQGKTLAEAVREACSHSYMTVEGTSQTVSPRSAYRWYGEVSRRGLAGLTTATAKGRPRPGHCLPQALLEFFRTEKARDRYASVPELLRRARENTTIGRDEHIDRVTAYRACVAMGLPMRHVPGKYEADLRRFAYPHRMMMVLADGKHFRAGVQRTRRVALFFLDDATRFGLDVIVGTAESSDLFLRGLHSVLERVGFMDSLFLDHGPGFFNTDTQAACARLGLHLIYGTAGYPEGHGKIERFNQTAAHRVLRGFPGNPAVDDDCNALTLRLRHFLDEQYNQTPHEALLPDSPRSRWAQDARQLRLPENQTALRDSFVVTESRTVSNDNVIAYDSLDYEVPRGHAGTSLPVHRRLLSGELLVLHDGALVRLHPVDLALNAGSRRARAASASPPRDGEAPPVTAAALAFARAFGSVVSRDGGFVDPRPTQEESKA